MGIRLGRIGRTTGSYEKLKQAPCQFLVSCWHKATMASTAKPTFKKEEATLVSGEAFKAVPVKDGASAIHAVLAMTLKHTADVFHAVLDAVADHYKISKDEMMDVVLAHPAYTGVVLDPVISDLGFLRPADEVPKATAPAAAAEAPKPKAKKFVVKKAISGAPSGAAPSAATPSAATPLIPTDGH